MKVPKRAIWLGMAMILFTGGVAAVVSSSGVGIALSAWGQSQPSPPSIVVCPQKLPLCQFTKIQDAINAAPDGSSATGYAPPAKIIVAPGVYEENLIILKSVILQGAERDQVILRPRPGGGRETRAIITVVGSTHPVYFQISGFTFQQTSDIGGAVGINLAGQGYTSFIYNSRFQNSGAGIYLTYSGRVIIRDNLFEVGEFGGNGIIMIDSLSVEVTRNTFLNLSKAFQGVTGIRIEASRGRSPQGSRIVVAQNTLSEIRGHGIVVSDSAGVEVRENTIERALIGIDVWNSSEAVTIQNNLMRSQRASGISIADSSVLIKGNRIEENQGHGIEILDLAGERAPAAELLQNQIFRNGQFGIWAERVEYVTVCKGNQLTGNKAGDYATGPITDPKASPELKAKCEGN